MLKAHKEIGAMPFLLFQYYLTWETASDGISPSLKTVADDLGLEPNAVCNLRKKLVQFGWIKYENGEVFILKTFTSNESDSHQVNERFTPSESTFTPDESVFTPSESPYKEEKEQRKNREKEEINTLSEADVLPEKKLPPKKVSKPKTEDAPELVKFRKTLAAFQKNYAEPTTQGAIIGNAAAIKKLFSLARGDTAICVEAHLFQQAEEWRKKRVDWVTVLKDFNFFLENRKHGVTNGTSIQKHQPTSADRRSQSAVDEYQRTELIRANLASRHAELRERDVSSRR